MVRLLIFTAGFLLFVSLGAFAMSVKNIGKLCLFSSISGVITLDGKPVANAKIKRVAHRSHVKGKKIDHTMTDESGRFSMPAVWDRNIIGSFLPMEFAAAQEVFVYVDGHEHQIWYAVKRKPQEYAESRGEPLTVTCDLTQEEKSIWVDGSPITSKCELSITPDTPIDFGPPLDD